MDLRRSCRPMSSIDRLVTFLSSFDFFSRSNPFILIVPRHFGSMVNIMVNSVVVHMVFSRCGHKFDEYIDHVVSCHSRRFEFV